MSKNNLISIEDWQEELFIYKGILFNNQNFRRDFVDKITYKFDCKEYDKLKEQYSISEIAGTGSEFEKASKLTAYFAPKLIHKGDYDNHINCNSLALLEYSLNQPEHGINCVNKSKILQECCLALGIYARLVWLMPYSPYDFDNHAVNEIYDKTLNKWIMLDLTANGYFEDETGTPLSVLEMRKKFALNLTCNFKKLSDNVYEYFDNSKTEQLYYNKYFAKNLFYFIAEKENKFGDSEARLIFLPEGFNDMQRQKMNCAFRNDEIYEYENITRSKGCDLSCLTSEPKKN